MITGHGMAILESQKKKKSISFRLNENEQGFKTIISELAYLQILPNVPMQKSKPVVR